MRENPFKTMPARERKRINKINQSLPEKLTLVDKYELPPHAPNLMRAWRSRHFVVQEFRHKNCIRLTINRSRVIHNGEWDTDIKWEELQKIKRDIGYGDHVAVEVYPKDKNIVNAANMRHLWIPDTEPDYGKLHGDD